MRLLKRGQKTKLHVVRPCPKTFLGRSIATNPRARWSWTALETSPHRQAKQLTVTPAGFTAGSDADMRGDQAVAARCESSASRDFFHALLRDIPQLSGAIG